MKTRKTKPTYLFALLVVVLTTVTLAARYPDTVWVKVTFYDYKANGSNPDFEACNPGYQPA